MEENENVVDFPGITRLNLDPERVIKASLKKKFSEIVLIGTTEDGEFYFASSVSDGGSVLWLLEGARHELIKIGYDN